MTPIEEFEKLWRESEEPLLTLKQNSLYFYLAAIDEAREKPKDEEQIIISQEGIHWSQT